jgi:uncharacterized protein YyaL (SSP411 family)
VANRLAAESSPYLRQHMENPVDWYPWGEEAFQAARGLDRPVLLSVGYSACHWCHVMARECFENPEIAALMNRLFVNIKVDREERPDIDSVYMEAVQAMTGQGGWPMTVFLTPDGAPYFGGTYFPPVDRGGMHGFPEVLRAAHDAFLHRRDDVERAGQEIIRELAPSGLPAGAAPDVAAVTAAIARLVAETDHRHGGFGGAPKFPHPGAIELLLRGPGAGGGPASLEAARVSLDAMRRGGICDQIGGGFHRYSVDGRWSVPHFEKMLYDNAQLALVYLHSHQLTGDEEHRRTAEATLDYMAREMLCPGGGFASSQDADSESVEGRFFVWSPEEIGAALGGGADAELACHVFGVSAKGNVEGGRTVLSLPVPLDQLAEALGMPAGDLRERVSGIAGRLREARSRRPAPARDDKVITLWNALALRAFAEAGTALGRPDYVEVARSCAAFLLGELVIGGRVRRSWRDGRTGVPGFLEDVAGLADGLLALYEATGEPVLFERALALAGDIPRYHLEAGAGYFDTANDAEPLPIRPRRLEDNPLPAGQSLVAQLFLRLSGLTGDGRWRERALEIIWPFVPAIARAPLMLSNLGCALEQAVAPEWEVAVVGGVEEPATRALLAAVWRRYDPHRVLAWGPAGAVPLLDDRPLIDGRPTAYVCKRFACLEPVTDPARLATQLEGVAVGPG